MELELRRRWWNGRYGRLAQRRVWLYAGPDDRWTVAWREGDADAETHSCAWHCEPDATIFIEHALLSSDPDLREIVLPERP